MKRARQVKDAAAEIIDRGEKPSAVRLADQIGYSEPDIHRCLNFLEKNGEVKTYSRNVFGTRHRMVSVKRT